MIQNEACDEAITAWSKQACGGSERIPVYACMYVCMYVCMHACMHAYMYVCMYVRTYVCMYVCIYAAPADELVQCTEPSEVVWSFAQSVLRCLPQSVPGVTRCLPEAATCTEVSPQRGC